MNDKIKNQIVTATKTTDGTSKLIEMTYDRYLREQRQMERMNPAKVICKKAVFGNTPFITYFEMQGTKVEFDFSKVSEFSLI